MPETCPRSAFSLSAGARSVRASAAGSSSTVSMSPRRPATRQAWRISPAAGRWRVYDMVTVPAGGGSVKLVPRRVSRKEWSARGIVLDRPRRPAQPRRRGRRNGNTQEIRASTAPQQRDERRTPARRMAASASARESRGPRRRTRDPRPPGGRHGHARHRRRPGTIRNADPGRETGPASAAVARRITKSCAGWLRPTTTREFFEAVHATDPTHRQATLIGMWLREAPIDEVLLACAEEAYTLRELIAAIHRTGNAHRHPARNRELNRLVRAQ